MKRSLLTLSILLPLAMAYGDVVLPPIISDNMLLQQHHAAVWGKASPNESVAVTLGSVVANTHADPDGRWRVMLDGLKPGLAGNMTISGGVHTCTVQNVAVGDVWVCSGQSNMEMMVGPGFIWKGYSGVVNFEKEIAAARFPGIRLFHVTKIASETPVEEVEGKWEVCTPDTVPDWSAVGYFFARQLHQDLKLPIGMIQAAWGGTFVESWTPIEVIRGDADFKAACEDPYLAQVAKYPALKDQFEKETLPAWKAAAETAKNSGNPVPPQPNAPVKPGANPGTGPAPGVLYNAMISGATKYPIKGALWYQGESNVAATGLYERLLPAMIDAWRKAWDSGEFPFYIVQLASFQARHPEPTNSSWANMRDAQRKIANKVPQSGVAVTIDLGEEKNIHPNNKQEVGRRLALLAEARTYGLKVVATGPEFAAAEFEGANVKITFRPGTALFLLTKDGGPVKGFAIAGEDKKFVWAEAKIIPNGLSGPRVIVSSPQVPKPVAVRYGWDDNPDVNLVNQAKLPAGPFATDASPHNGN